MAPQHHALPVLLTRPAEQAHRFAKELAVRFGDRLQTIISPLMVAEYLAPDWPDLAYTTAILTSETGVAAAVRLRNLGRVLPDRAICVGDRTASVAQAAGFQAVSAKGDAEVLLDLILASDDPGPFLHLRGREARGDIAPRLAAKGRPAQSAIVYQQRPQPLTARARAILDGPDPVIIPLFSPRSVTLLAESGPFRAPLLIAAISATVAEKAKSLAPARLEQSATPDGGGMLDAVGLLIPDAAS